VLKPVDTFLIQFWQYFSRIESYSEKHFEVMGLIKHKLLFSYLLVFFAVLNSAVIARRNLSKTSSDGQSIAFGEDICLIGAGEKRHGLLACPI